MKPAIIQILGEQLAGKSQLEARRLVDAYFNEIVWSLEKEEWEKMSEREKKAFTNYARREKTLPRPGF
jgi:hypothetical protein